MKKADLNSLKEIENNEQIAINYCDEDGIIENQFNPNGSIKNIAGIFNTGFVEFDQSVIFLTINDALSIFDKNSNDQNLEIYLKDPLEADSYKKKIHAIGFSGHHKGLAADIAALAFGAEFFERHFTLDRTWKGTDHAASLEPDGLRKLLFVSKIGKIYQ